MISISYDIVARLWDEEGSIASASKTVRVIPSSDIQAPFPVEEDESCRLRDERLIRKGPFKKKSGIISMEAELPGPILYKDAACRQNQEQISEAIVTLHLDLTDNGSTPPRLGALKTRFLITSYYGSRCRECFPTTQNTLHSPGQATYAAGIKVHNILCDKVGWYRVPHALPQVESLGTNHGRKRHDSFASAISFGSRRSSVAKTHCCYAMRLNIPIVLPKQMVLVPTFHSCLVSRTYTLQFHLEIEGSTAIELEVPVIVTAM